MIVKTSTMIGPTLDWAVELAIGTHWSANGYFCHSPTLFNKFPSHSYSTDWSQGGPILSREHISRTIDHSGLWIAYWTDGYTEGDEGKHWMHCHRSELVAGLRCFVTSKLGDKVDVPEELIDDCPVIGQF